MAGENEDKNLPIDYAFISYQELVNLSKEKESLQKQLFDFEEQMSKLQHKLDAMAAPLPSDAAALIQAAAGSLKKVLPNEAAFYQVLADHKLQGYVRNKNKFK